MYDKEAVKRWRETHREEYNAYLRHYYATHPEYKQYKIAYAKRYKAEREESYRKAKERKEADGND